MEKSRGQQEAEAWKKAAENAKNFGLDETKKLLANAVILDRPIPSKKLSGMKCGGCGKNIARRAEALVTCPHCTMTFVYVIVAAKSEKQSPWKTANFAKRMTNPDLKFAGVVHTKTQVMRYLPSQFK